MMTGGGALQLLPGLPLLLLPLRPPMPPEFLVGGILLKIASAASSPLLAL